MMGVADFASDLPAAIVTQERSCIQAFQGEFDYVCRTLRRLGVRSEDLEDQMHEVFLVLNRKWDQYDRSRPLRPYLFGIAFRVASAQKRRQQREVPQALEHLEAQAPPPDDALEAAQARELVLAALAQVPLPRRAVLVMHDIDEIPMRDIVRTLSLPLFTGYSRLRKARREFAAAVNALRKGNSNP
jgi:RNA polymerase sigma-70 factor (ECF subfamily)